MPTVDEFLKGEDFEVMSPDEFTGGEDFEIEEAQKDQQQKKPGFFSPGGKVDKFAGGISDFFFPQKFLQSIQGTGKLTLEKGFGGAAQQLRQEQEQGLRPSDLEAAGAAAKGGLSFLSLLGGGTASVGKQALQFGGLGAGIAGAQALEAGKGFKGAAAPAAITGLISAAVPPLAKGAASFIANRATKALGIFAGEHPQVIEAALRNPVAADAGAKGGDAALRKVIEEGSRRSVQLRNEFIQGHVQAFKEIAKGSVKRLVGKKEILSGFENLLRNENVKITRKGLDFSTSKIVANPGEISKIQNAYTAIKSWDDFTLEGLNRLKQLTGQLTKFADEVGRSSKSPTLGKAYNFINETISKNLSPTKRKAYEAMNRNFVSKIELFEDMVKTFNSGDPFQKLAGVFRENADSLRQIVNFYEKKTGKSVLGTVAGRKIGTGREAAFGFLNPRDWVDLLLPPVSQAKVIIGGHKIVSELAPRGTSLLGKFLRLGGQRGLGAVTVGEE